MAEAGPPVRRPGDVAVPLATALAAATASAAVAWAAASPTHSVPAAATPTVDTSPAVAQAEREVADLRGSLAGVRHDLLKLARLQLPRAPRVTGSGISAGSTAPSVRVPAAVAPAPVPAAAPPATHTTTGASGAPH